MKITSEKAIEELSGAGITGAFTYNDTFKAACRLGAEAIRAIKKLQEEFPTLPHLKLPSQTES